MNEFHFKLVPVDSNIVHKSHEDDVLIANSRGAIPLYLTQDDADPFAANDDLRELIDTFYPEGDRAKDTPDDEARSVRFLRSAVPFLSSAQVETLRTRYPEFPLEAYYRAQADGYGLTAKYMHELHEIVMMNLFVDRGCRISNYDRHILSGAFDEVAFSGRGDRLYVTMINDLKNYFFYRKHHEHVPGTMLIEVARQAIYAQFYRLSEFARGEVTLSIKSIDVDFDDYVDANYPVIVCIETTTDADELASTGFERRRATFYQADKRVAVIEFRGVAITMKLFQRLRRVKPDPAHWFQPVKNIARTVKFFGRDGRCHEGILNDIALRALDVTFLQEVPEEMDFSFRVEIEGIGEVHGTATLESRLPSPNGTVGVFKIREIPLECDRRWCEAIKNFTHLDMRREHY